MKSINSILTGLLLTASLFLTPKATAQAPQRMSYQSVIRNSSNVLLTNTQVGIKISVLQGSTTGTAVYEETQTTTTNANGLVSLQIGLGTAITGTFAGIDWANGPYFIKTETDPAGGTNYTITGTQEMLSVPYAMYAAKSGDTATTWSQNGNAGTDGYTHFIGTTDEVPFSIRVNNKIAGYIDYLEEYGSTSLGYQAGNTPTVEGYQAERNTAIGYQSLYSNFGGAANTAVGYRSLYSHINGYSNTAIGLQALFSNTSGSDNTAIGVSSLGTNSTGIRNTANGRNALGRNTTGTRNVAMGYFSLRNNSTGAQNVAIGENSLLVNTTGTQNTALGSEADVLTAALTNATAIGFGAKVNASNTIQLGNSSVTDVNTSGTYNAAGFKTPAGTSSQYLMADGSTSPRTTLGPIGGTATSNGGTITSGVLSLAPADATNGGIVTNAAQTFGGAKTFTQNVTANSFVKTNGTSSQYLMADGSTSLGTVATTMGAIGASSSANGGTITSGVLSLAPADATNGGIVTNATQTFAGSKTFAADLNASQNIISGTPSWATDGKIQSWNTNYNGRVLSVIGNNASYTGAAATFWNQGSGPSVAVDYAGSGQKIISFQNQGNEVASVKTNGAINANSLISTGTVGVGTASPNASAILEASSTTKGMLIPRMTGAQKMAISSPAIGLMIFQTDETSGYYYYNGSTWGMVGNMPAGTSISDMLYWNGSLWVPISAGTVGQVLTLGSNGPVWQTPASTILSTTGASNIQATTATCGGNIFITITPVAARGVCWNTSPNPTTANSVTADGTGIGAFSSSLTGLMANTTYYVRAYATNQVGTTYGNEISFTTISPTLPTLITTAVTDIYSGQAVSGGSISSGGGVPVTARGVCWSTSANPTTANSITANGTGIGTFSSSLTGLMGSTTYYVRAYATNEVGTTYGNQVSFTTLTTIPPTISTIITGLSSIQASFRSDFSVGMRNDIWLSHGACWSTSTNPTTSDNHTTSYPNLWNVNMLSTITGLTANTTYYVRCYITTTAGTYYATNQVVFKTAPTEIGQPYLGGKMAYVLQPDDPNFNLLVCKGLIAAPTDQNAGAWGCGTNISGAAGTALGQGNLNTSAIVAAGCAQAGSAAQLCSDLVFGGYSDWFLPSIDELKMLWNNRVAIGGFSGTKYWSSTDYNYNGNAWYYDFGNGDVQTFTVTSKGNVNSVRAVRAF